MVGTDSGRVPTCSDMRKNIRTKVFTQDIVDFSVWVIFRIYSYFSHKLLQENTTTETETKLLGYAILAEE